MSTRVSRSRLLSTVAGSLVLVSLPTGNALAQEVSAEESGAAGSREEQDTIIVTATRRDMTVQTAPINIAAIGGAQLERDGLRSISEATRAVPGINIIDQGPRGGSNIVVRGLNAQSLVNNDNSNDGGGTVATYLGETPIFLELKLNDIERVEVLLGPQGTLYGAGTLGGAIRYIPRRPQFDAITVDVRADGYTYSHADGMSFDAGLTVNIPVSDTFALRAVVDRLDDSGFIDQNYLLQEPGVSLPNALGSASDIAANFRSQSDVNFERSWSGRVAARFEPTDAIDLNLTYYFQFQDIGGRQASSSRVDHLPVSFGEYESALRVLEPSTRDNEIIAFEGTFDLGFAELTSSTSYAMYSQRSQRDQTDLGIELGFFLEYFPGFVDFTDEILEEDRFSQEVRLVSQGDGPFNWTIGGFYNHFNRSIDYTEFTPGLHDAFAYAQGDDRDFLLMDLNERSEYAAYGEFSYDLTDAWTATVGLRYYNYDLTISSASAVAFPNGFPATGPVFNFVSYGQADDGFLGKINTSYRFSPDVLGYATISQGYRAGGSNGLPPCPDPVPANAFCGLPDELQYTPDKTTNYELGIKSQLFDNRVTLNGALFYIDWQDVQLGAATQSAAIGITVNGEGASSKGVEMTLDAEVIDNLNLQASYTYTDAQLDELSPNLIRTIAQPGTTTNYPVFAGIFLDGQSGDRLPGSAKHRGSFSLSYDAEISNSLELNLGWSTVISGNVLSSAGGRGDSLTLPSYTMSFARVGLTNFEDDWSVTLYMNNVFDQFVEVGARGTSLYNQAVAGGGPNPVYNRRFSSGVLAPRRVGLRFTKGF